MKRNILALTICCLVGITNLSVHVYAYDNEVEVSNLKDAQDVIYNHLLNRDPVIEFIYKGTTREFKDDIVDTIRAAYTEDDYTERSWVQINPSAKSEDNKVYTTIKVDYLTTNEQENYVDEQVKNIISQIIKPSMTELEKIRAINDYLVSKYDYDYSYTSNNAYTALSTGKTICQGYSMTAYKMLKSVGIKNRIIVGTANGITHSWNYVQVGQSWFHLDITNNDATRSDKYFLVSDDVLKDNKYVWIRNLI